MSWRASPGLSFRRCFGLHPWAPFSTDYHYSILIFASCTIALFPLLEGASCFLYRGTLLCPAFSLCLELLDARVPSDLHARVCVCYNDTTSQSVRTVKLFSGQQLAQNRHLALSRGPLMPPRCPPNGHHGATALSAATEHHHRPPAPRPLRQQSLPPYYEALWQRLQLGVPPVAHHPQ